MKRRILSAHGLNFAIGPGSSRAFDPTGRWEWNRMRAKRRVEVLLEITRIEKQLSGTIQSSRRPVAAIESVEFADGTLSFTDIRKQRGQQAILRFSGQVFANAIIGSVVARRGGRTLEFPWRANKSQRQTLSVDVVAKSSLPARERSTGNRRRRRVRCEPARLFFGRMESGGSMTRIVQVALAGNAPLDLEKAVISTSNPSVKIETTESSPKSLSLRLTYTAAALGKPMDRGVIQGAIENKPIFKLPFTAIRLIRQR